MNMDRNNSNTPWKCDALFCCGSDFLHVELDHAIGWRYMLYRYKDDRYTVAAGGYILGNADDDTFDSIAAEAVNEMGVQNVRITPSAQTLSELLCDIKLPDFYIYGIPVFINDQIKAEWPLPEKSSWIIRRLAIDRLSSPALVCAEDDEPTHHIRLLGRDERSQYEDKYTFVNAQLPDRTQRVYAGDGLSNREITDDDIARAVALWYEPIHL